MAVLPTVVTVTTRVVGTLSVSSFIAVSLIPESEPEPDPEPEPEPDGFSSASSRPHFWNGLRVQSSSSLSMHTLFKAMVTLIFLVNV